MLLNFKEYAAKKTADSRINLSGKPDVPVFFLHGLLGNADNWSSTARELSGAGLRCITVDARNHGSSPHSSGMSYPLMAADLIELADYLAIGRFCIVGHSMGGKTAMEAALSFPDRLESAVIADIAPVRYKPAYVDYINALKTIDLSDVTSRSEAGAQLEKIIPDRSLVMFFLTNLRRGDDGLYRWRINLDGIINNYDNIWTEIEGGRSFNGRFLFVRGSRSEFVLDAHLPVIKELFPNYGLKTIEGSGHWVHTEKPGKFRSILKLHYGML